VTLGWDVMLPVLAGAALHAGWNASIRRGSDSLLDTALVVAGAAVISALMLAWLPPPAPACWPYLAATAVIHLVYFNLVALAYGVGELSLVYPIMRGAPPLFTALGATLLLGEAPAPGVWAGIALVSGGILFLAAGAGPRPGRGRAPIALALANAAVIVAYTLVDGTGVRLSGQPLSYVAWLNVLSCALTLPAAAAARGRAAAAFAAKHWIKGLLGGAATLGAYGLTLWAMTRAPIGLVAALRETSIVFATIIAAALLKERVAAPRWAAAAAVAAGAAVMKFL
jgi:drug/metabolite transporter (DMT)-like permease